MIDIENISKRFGKLQALDEVNLQFGEGECIALIGPNGCGKTTLIKSILGMVIPDSGNIKFRGKPIVHDHNYRHQIGYMPQKGRYPDNMSIGQVIDMIRDIRGKQEVIDEELIEAFDLLGMSDKKMRTLSGGTTQKVSAALAFMFSPDALILDEPTAGLDPLASEILKDKIIAESRQGKLVLITSHLLTELDELVTHVVLMQDGKIGFHLPVAELKTKTQTPNLSRAITQVLRHGHV